MKAIGFSPFSRHEVKMIEIGDQIIVYIKGSVSIAGILEAVSRSYLDDTPLFNGEQRFPYRVDVVKKMVLDRVMPFTRELIMQLEFIRNKTRWVSHIQGKHSFRQIPEADFVKISDYLHHKTIT